MTYHPLLLNRQNQVDLWCRQVVNKIWHLFCPTFSLTYKYDRRQPNYLVKIWSLSFMIMIIGPVFITFIYICPVIPAPISISRQCYLCIDSHGPFLCPINSIVVVVSNELTPTATHSHRITTQLCIYPLPCPLVAFIVVVVVVVDENTFSTLTTTPNWPDQWHSISTRLIHSDRTHKNHKPSPSSPSNSQSTVNAKTKKQWCSHFSKPLIYSSRRE